MKIKEIKEKYENAVENCRKKMVESIIELCRESGIDPSLDIMFGKPLIIHTTKVKTYKKRFNGYETETVIADRISWCPDHPNTFHLGWQGNYCKASFQLTLDQLSIVYSEMAQISPFLKSLSENQPV